MAQNFEHLFLMEFCAQKFMCRIVRMTAVHRLRKCTEKRSRKTAEPLRQSHKSRVYHTIDVAVNFKKISFKNNFSKSITYCLI